MDRCPTCRAETKGNRHCRRCKTDLRPLWDIEEQTSSHFEAARAAYESGDYDAMFFHARRSFSLHRFPANRRLLAIAALLVSRRSMALSLWKQAANPSSCRIP